jgi:signal peptidase
MKITLKTVWNIFYTLVIVVLVLVAGALTVSAFNIPGGLKLYTVQSGSMEPAILTGSIVISQPASEYRVNDVITYKSKEEITNPNPKVTTTHRIVDTQEVDGKTEFVTKGDANDGRDGGTVSTEQILGKEVFSVPFLGYPVAFARTQMGLIVLIIIPATMIIYSELMNIKNEAMRLLKERKKRKLSMLEKAEVAVGEEVMATEKEIKKVEKELAKDIKDLKKVVNKEEKAAKAKVKK